MKSKCSLGLVAWGLVLCTLVSLSAGRADAIDFPRLSFPEWNFPGWTEVAFEDHRVWKIAVTTGYTIQELNGDIDLGDDSSNIKFDDALGLDDDRKYWGRIDIQPFIRHHLRITYTPLEFDGSNTVELGDEFRLGSVTTPVGTAVDSKIELTSYDIVYQYDAAFMGEKVTLSPLLQVSLLDLDGQIENQGRSEGVSFFVPVPAIGFRMEAHPFRRFGFHTEVKGMTIGKTATTYDVEGGIMVHILRNLQLDAKYRYLVYDVNTSGAKLDATISGPYVGLGLRF